MSNQFFNFISSILIKYFQDTLIQAGDRFYLQLDTQKEIDKLVHALREQGNGVDFVYKHKLGTMKYQTFSIQINDISLVIAFTSNEVKPDFLVTLRNLVGEQQDEWKKTALLSIVSEQLDSIQGGSSDLQKEGMPLHSSNVYNLLKEEIDKSPIDLVTKKLLLFNLDNLMEEHSFQQITFFEFEEVYETLTKGFLEDEDYKNIGLFKDEDLATYNGKEFRNRIQLNQELFNTVKRVHEYGFDEEELEKKFSPEGAKKLFEDNWYELPFSEVYHYHEDFKKLKQKTKVTYDTLTVKGNLKWWDKPQKDTTAGRRKRHIMIFNPEQLDEINMQFTFSLSGGEIKSLQSKFLTMSKNFENICDVNVGKKNITARIRPFKDKVTFCRFVYKHDKKTNLGAEFVIAVIPCENDIFATFKTNYLINSQKEVLEFIYESTEIIFGQDRYIKKEVNIIENKQFIEYDIDEQLILSINHELTNGEEDIFVSIRIIPANVTIPVLFKNEVSDAVPINAMNVWKTKNKYKKDFEWINNKLVMGNEEKYIHAEYRYLLEWELQWKDESFRCGRLDADTLIKEDIELSEELREAYSRFVTYFDITNSVPSLCFYSEELVARAKEYIKAYINAIKNFDENSAVGKKGRDLFKLGTIFSNQEILFTPYHPLMVAYQLIITKELDNFEIDQNILKRLKPSGLIPYIFFADDTENNYSSESDLLFRPDHEDLTFEWMSFKPVNQVSVAEANQYLAKVIEDKLNQFKEHFDFMFIPNSKAPVLLNVISINNDKEVLRGILNWMIKEIDKYGLENVKPVEVTLYKDDSIESSFDIFARIESVDHFKNVFDLKLNSKKYDETDILRGIRENLFYYKKNEFEDYKYAHITFYKMQAQEKSALHPMKDMQTGLSLNGIYSSVASMKGQELYKTGFGIKSYSFSDSDEDLLIRVAFYLNELAANLRNGGNDTYRKGAAIYSRTTTTDEETLDKIYKSSYWVTFVDPTIDLDYFNDNDKNIVVIHYSDQYTSSSRYDAITVTDKSQQFIAVIKEFLASKQIEGTDESVRSAIKTFNTFNGEWLLRIIGGKGQFTREKLSIISAIKFSLAYFDHNDILWVPISLEEILRVAGAVSLNKSSGIFTAKNLGVEGVHSDDLLLIGLEKCDNHYEFHFFPVEVKIGYNRSNVLQKAKQQVIKTKDLIINTLTSNEEGEFISKFYRNFFVQLFISNAKKVSNSNLWPQKNFNLEDEVIEKLLKDEYVISNKLDKIIGKGAILSFEKDAFIRSAYLENEITFVNLTENDGFQGLVQSIDELYDWIHNKSSDFKKEFLLAKQSIQILETDEGGFEKHNNEKTEQFDNAQDDKLDDFPNNKLYDKQQVKKEMVTTEEESVHDAIDNYSISSVQNARLLIGEMENSNRKIYWEYGNSELANRHLLISGKSGQGKTYFMQGLLLELSKQNISSIVVDYTEGFLPNQLEKEFQEFLGDRIKQKIVFTEKLPINPFQRTERDIGGISLPETNTDVAERIKGVFAAVYKSMKIQQLNSIYEAVIRGLEKYDEEMNLPRLKDELEEDGSSYAKTALSQIRPLIDRNPFSNEKIINWNEIIDSNGDVYIIQLTGYNRDVQLIITEFILWDLWNYAVKFGNKNKPIPIVLDEAQNLDHTEKSPSARILTEGRKFGLSAWYATQFLKSQLEPDELARLQNASEKIYFAPPEQEVANIANSLSLSPNEKKDWETKLLSLRKGQCIVNGPILDDNKRLSRPVAITVNVSSLSERLN